MNAGEHPVIGMADVLNATGAFTMEIPCPRSRSTATIRCGCGRAVCVGGWGVWVGGWGGDVGWKIWGCGGHEARTDDSLNAALVVR